MNLSVSPFGLGRRTAVLCWVLVGIVILADAVCSARTGQHVPIGENDHADHLAILSRGRRRHAAHDADVVQDGGPSNVRALKKSKRKKSYTGSVSSDDVTPLVSVITPSPTPAPSAAPTDQCETASFTTSREDYVGGNSNGVTTFSFTNEVDLTFDCDDLVNSVGSSGAIESVLVAYQNNLLMQYGCSDDISYSAAAVTHLCILGDSEEGSCIETVEEICPSRRERRLQNSSVKSAAVR